MNQDPIFDMSTKRIGVLDLSIGNTGSILNMIRSIGGRAERLQDKHLIERCDALILPGVGKFDHGITRLRELGFEEPLSEAVLNKRTPILGICLGMQLMCSNSEEGACPGLRWIEGLVKRLPRQHQGEKLVVPHMGWNRVRTKIHHGPLTGMDNSRFYFVHSYALFEAEDDIQTAATTYGPTFISGFVKDNIVAVQFHPEKSHQHGKKFFRNFIAWISNV